MENKQKIDGNDKIWKGKLRERSLQGKKGKLQEVESQNKCKVTKWKGKKKVQRGEVSEKRKAV